MTTPASTAEQYLYSADGHYHYSAFCCNNSSPHYAVISSTSPISPLGCGSVQPPLSVSVDPIPIPVGGFALNQFDDCDYRSSATVGTTPIDNSLVYDHPTSIIVSVQIPVFRFSQASMVDARLKQRSFRLIKIVRPTIAGTNPVRRFPTDIYVADWCRSLPADPSAIPQVTGSDQRASKNAAMQPGNIYRVIITQGPNKFETWLVYRVTV